MKRMMIMMTAAACLGVMAIAQDEIEEPVEKVKKEKKVKAPKVKKVKKPKAPKPVPEEITVSGVITKNEIKKGDKIHVKYVLTDTEGNKIMLPKPKKPKNGGELIKLENYVEGPVKLIGTGIKIKKKGKDIILLKTLISIEKPKGVADIEIFPKHDAVEDGEGAVE